MRLKIGITSLLILCSSFISMAADQGEVSEKDKPPATGIDETEIIGRYAVNYAFIEKDTGTRRHNVALAFEKDVSKSVKVGIGIPITYAETAAGDDALGLGELKLTGGWRFYHTPGFSALVSARIILDTTTDEILGDGSNRMVSRMVGSWRRSAWLLSLAGGWTWSEERLENDVSISPLLGYQPMGKYLSYITVGPSFIYGLETEEEAISITAFLGKVLRNKDVIALGSRYNIKGVDDNKAFLLLSWKRLF